MAEAVLVTGGAGFAGRHLLDRLREEGRDPAAPRSSEVDLLDAAATRAAVARTRPDVVFHLAGEANVGGTLAAPTEVMRVNYGMTANLLEAVRAEAPSARVVMASSGEIYGRPDSLPVDESAPLRPRNPYAVSKAAADLLGAQCADAHGLAVTRMRAFNHAGPGQRDDFVIGTLCRQAAEAEARGEETLTLRTGSLDSARDFTDVRDVVRAYVLAAHAEPGAYNVCSGTATRVDELVELLRAASPLRIECEVDPARVRPNEVREVRGSAAALTGATGWAPEIPLERTVADALEAWRRALAPAA